jgi:hypothetical protein
VLTRIYAGCVVGLDEVWIARMSAGFALVADSVGEKYNKPGQPGGTTLGERGDWLGCSGRRIMAYAGEF